MLYHLWDKKDDINSRGFKIQILEDYKFFR